MIKWIVIIILVSIGTTIKAQSGIPAIIKVVNPYTDELVSTASIALEKKGINGSYEGWGMYKTDEQGKIALSLFLGQAYTLTIKKTGYYTQIVALTTDDLSRLSNNAYSVSLRPKDCFRLRGTIEMGSQNKWSEASIRFTETKTQDTWTTIIRSDNSYKTCAKCGGEYAVHILVRDSVIKEDVVTLNKDDCTGQRNPLATINFTIDTTTSSLAVDKGVEVNYEIGDSIVIENLVFEGKTKALEKNALEALEKISQLLLNNKALVVAFHIYTAPNKSARYNWLVAQKRAIVIGDYLKEQGVPEKQFKLIPKGEKKTKRRKQKQIKNWVEMHVIKPI